ncbi:hypothetical protein HKD37_07G019677 [Glycine soja]
MAAWALAADQDGVDDTVYEKYDISKEKWAQFCQTRSDPSWEDVQKKAQAIQKQNTAPHVLSHGGYEYLEQKLIAEKTKKKLEEATQSGTTDGVIDPPSPIRCHVKWKMARTKKTGQMTSEAAKEIAEKILSHFQLRILTMFDSLEEQASQGSFIPHGRQDVLIAAIVRPDHPGHVHAVGAVTIKQYFGLAPRISRSSSFLLPEDLQQLTQQIKDQLEESITEKMQSQRLALPPEPMIGPSGPRVSTKESYVDPSGNDPETGDSDKCRLYIEANPPRPVALGRVYEGSTVHNIPLLSSQVKAAVSLAKPPQRLDPEVDDQLYLMTLTIPDLEAFPDFPLYIKHEDLSEITHGGQCLSISVLQLWILMRARNSDVYGFLEPQSIQRSGQSQFDTESYIKSWMQSSKCDVYLGAYLNGEHWQMVVILPKENLVVWFCSLHNRPDNYLKGIINKQKGSTKCGYYVMHWMSTIILGSFRNNWQASIQRSGQSQFESESYIKSWIQSSKRDVYLGAYLNSGHWQMVVILPKENLVVWFCSLHNRPDNYLKGIINSALKGLDDTPQPKSKAAARWIVVKCNRQKGITECGYYVMHWMSTIILGSFRNNWETYFNEVRPLEAERFKALRIQWAQYYLKVRNQT